MDWGCLSGVWALGTPRDLRWTLTVNLILTSVHQYFVDNIDVLHDEYYMMNFWRLTINVWTKLTNLRWSLLSRENLEVGGGSSKLWILWTLWCPRKISSLTDDLLIHANDAVSAGVLDDVQTYYNINDKEASLVSTAFIISYMLLSPLFGYLGDRYNRTVIMSIGITGWSAITLASSFVDRQVDRFSSNLLTFDISTGQAGLGNRSK